MCRSKHVIHKSNCMLVVLDNLDLTATSKVNGGTAATATTPTAPPSTAPALLPTMRRFVLCQDCMFSTIAEVSKSKGITHCIMYAYR